MGFRSFGHPSVPLLSHWHAGCPAMSGIGRAEREPAAPVRAPWTDCERPKWSESLKEETDEIDAGWIAGIRDAGRDHDAHIGREACREDGKGSSPHLCLP